MQRDMKDVEEAEEKVDEAEGEDNIKHKGSQKTLRS